MPINYGTNNLTTSGNITAISGSFTTIGIGTSSPGSPLTISSSGGAGTIGGVPQTQIFQVNDGSATNYVNLGHFNVESDVSRGSFLLSNNGTNGAWQDNFLGFYIHGQSYAYGHYGGNINDAGCAMIIAQGSDITKLQIGNYEYAPIEFFTNNIFRMKIDAVGNVGIGTNSPQYRLHVVGTGNFSQNLLVNGTGVSLSGHSHTSSSITDFNSSVSGLLNKSCSFFTATQNQPPASGFATLDTRNSIPVLEFDAATNESAVFMGVLPSNVVVSSGLIADLWWMADTATSGNVVWSVQFEAQGTDNDTDSFDVATSGTAAANGTSGIETETAITCTSIDSLTAGKRYRLKVNRVATDAGDTMTGDAQLIGVEVRMV